jgi:hypothetical protein
VTRDAEFGVNVAKVGLHGRHALDFG